MAFVRRTTRDSDFVGTPKPQTAAHIGPGAYVPPSAFGQQRPNYAPFASTSARDSGSPTPLQTPGPGTYAYVSSSSRGKAGAAAFRSGTARFNRGDRNEAPGPGQYGGHREWTRRRRGAMSRRSKSSASAQGPVTWVRVPTAPSIPATHQSFGYDEGTNGELVMQRDPRNVYTGPGTVGPGAYELDDARPRLARGGANFARDRTQRTDFTKAAKDAPGPGNYAAPIPSGVTAQNSATRRPTSVFASTASRDQAPRSPEREKAPGPGSYSLPSGFRKVSVPETRQFFGSTARRFDEGGGGGMRSPGAGGPGPGAYRTEQQSSFRTAAGVEVIPARGGAAATAPSVRSHRVPFGSSTSRFDSRPPKTTTPGAGTYQSESFTERVQRRLASRAAVFGSTSRRFAERREATALGPGSYGEAGGAGAGGPSEGRPVGGKVAGAGAAQLASLRQPTSSFASSSGRFGQWSKKADEQAPPPGQYEVTLQWGRGRQGLLRGTGERFVDKPSEGPAPGQYHEGLEKLARRGVAAVTGHAGNPLVARSERFRDTSAKASPLGPGSYDTEYLYGNLNRPTFNISIAEDSAL